MIRIYNVHIYVYILNKFTSGRRAKSKLFPLKNSMKEKKHIETDTVAKQTVQAALQLGVLVLSFGI